MYVCMYVREERAFLPLPLSPLAPATQDTGIASSNVTIVREKSGL